MQDLGINASDFTTWFKHLQDEPYVFIRISAAHASSWAELLKVPLRRCYIADDTLDKNATRTGRMKSELVAAKLPDLGATMAGDFGEILVYLYHSAQEYPANVIGPKKWRLKQDRNKPAPYSDVVHMVLPSWPESTEDDLLLCSEVKTKSTNGGSSPITEAIADCEKDRTSRLAKTLTWLRERALGEDLGSTTVAHLERFINATDHPLSKKRFHAVAVVCASLIDNELADAPDDTPEDYTVVVISVPALKRLYEAVYDAAYSTVSQREGTR